VTTNVDRGIMQFASAVLIKSEMPATLNEGYFLTSTAEQGKLQANYSGYVGVEAQALYDGVVAYLGSNGGGGDADPSPGAPAPMTATLKIIRGPNATIDVAWANVTDEDGYRVYRSTNGVDYEVILDNVAVDTTSTQDRVKAGPTYQYCVVAFNGAGDSEWACSGTVATS